MIDVSKYLTTYSDYTIYFDLDGVLVDLSTGLAKLEGYDDPVLWFLHRQEEFDRYVYPKVIEMYIDQQCFATLPPMPHFEEMKKVIAYLKNKGYNIKILSSCMDTHYSDKITEQKKAWVLNHMQGLVTIDDINIVRGSELKIDFIKDDENSILIDDYTRTQKTFIENGIGDQFILYKSFYGFIQALKNKQIID